jgi:excisionase family DNA binding protein
MESYTNLAGEVLEYESPPAKVAAFLARVIDATHDPGVTEAAMTELVYGPENPILAQGVLEHHGVVTKEVFENPLYHVMTDLLGRKRVQAGTLDPPKAREEYTVTIAEAADQLGVHPSAVRQAVHAKTLDAIKVGGSWRLKPSSVASYRVSRRSPAGRSEPVATAVVGSVDGASFRLKILGGKLTETGRHDRRVEGTIDRFDRMAVISGPKGKYRFFEIEPAATDEAIEFGPFFVKGRYRIVTKENNPRRASEAWREFAKSTS